jgi:ATP-binding cassette subfamily B protein
MFKDLKQYFDLLAHYLKSKWGSVTSGVLLGMVAQTCALVSPLLTRYLIDVVITQKHYSLLNNILVMAGIVLAVLLVSSLTSSYILENAFKQVGVHLKSDLFTRLQEAPLEFFEKEQSGGMTYRLLGDTESLASSWSQVVVTLPLQLILLGSAVFMIHWNLDLTFFVFAVLILQVFVIVKFRKPLLRYAQLSRAKGQELNGHTVETLGRIQLTRALASEPQERKTFFTKVNELARVEIRAFMVSKYSDVLLTLISNLWSFGILWYGGHLVIIGTMSLGTLMAFLMFANMLYSPISTITNFFLSFQSVRVILSRVLEYLKIKPTVTEARDAIELIVEQGKVTLDNVTFSYGTVPVLRGATMELMPNSITALIGASGAGKTTLAKLITRFYDPAEGAIFIDGIDIRRLRIASLRKQVLLMLQNSYVFSGTILENVTYGSATFSAEEVAHALSEAGVDFLSKCPKGLDTPIGEGGVTLSGGEAQRIALARAFLLSPRVLILDEPTSSVDGETEEKIRQTLMTLKQHTTSRQNSGARKRADRGNRNA